MLVLQINGNYYQNEHTKVVHLACFDAMEWVFEHLSYISFDAYVKKCVLPMQYHQWWITTSFLSIEKSTLEKLK